MRETQLTDAHRHAGARMADFGGWEMPIEYPTGVVAEHVAVRTAVGVFDVSHMGRLVVRGSGAVEALNQVLANDLDRIGSGQAQYSMLCNAHGGVVDDLLVYRSSDSEVRIVPNAANTAAVRGELMAALPAGLVVADRQDAEGIVAVQGPRSRDVVDQLGLLPPGEDLAYMSFAAGDFRGADVVVSRSGYTGEHGYEVLAPAEALVALWDELCARAMPCGLGARDTLRTEMGYPLHGQELSESITPLEAGMSWAVGWDKQVFAGRDALLAQRAAGRPRALRGLRVDGRGIPRPHMAVRTPDGRPVGQTTSGTFSPTLRVGIALALLDPAIDVGDVVEIDVRGRAVPARVVKLPFVDRSPRD
ncbi:MAG: glycine cleavage system aminomethyltransferase GcvT [Candidatus Nanopelagicales bacterium]